jgi:hypothetical protein
VKLPRRVLNRRFKNIFYRNDKILTLNFIVDIPNLRKRRFGAKSFHDLDNPKGKIPVCGNFSDLNATQIFQNFVYEVLALILQSLAL